ncbi:uncharacterized protein LOC143914464 isoform X2 [Arctopsyche grandis]|uniref:uncharacterized protein LOC143914464 isoform X2 n=1 Tax=Arctopsyche grandis TaxID=121162 RepID=UPI00406D8F03
MLTWMRWNWILIILSNMSSVLAQGCISPPNPIFGKYLINGATVAAGENVNSYSTLTYECDDMYTRTGSQSMYCGPNGTWIGSMKCAKKCKLPDSLTLDFTCSLNNRNIECEKFMDYNAVVTPKCKFLHKPNENQNLNPATCKNGRWTDVLRECTTDCGRQNAKVTTFLLNADLEERDLSPWHVGVYQLNKNQVYEQMCGGTIVSRKYVISAAHCFLQTPYEDYYAVAAGKLYRAWDHKEKDEFPHIQRKMIETIKIPSTYYGFDNNLEDDIAIIVVRTPFDFYPQVHAACFDVNNAILRTYSSPNNPAKVVGWGVTVEGDQFSSSDMLMKADILLVNRNDCIREVPREFIKFVSPTKFCVKGARNMTICNGDSGGGILVRILDKGTLRWHLVGVVSVGILNTLRTTCQTNTHTAITSISSHEDFIINELQNACSLIDGTQGVCKTLGDCKRAQQQTNKDGINQEICSSSNSQTMVCCPSDASTTTTAPVKPSGSSTYKECDFPKDAITVSRTGQKAWDKCIDLADSVFPCVPLSTGSFSPKMRRDTCKHTGVEIIVGGISTKPDEFPHQALLGYDNDYRSEIDWFCGGSLISELWVMAAAQCLNPISGNMVKYVRLGGEDMDKHTPEFLFNVIERVVHPNYTSRFIYNDIGLIKLDKTIKYSEKIRPACLHVGNQVNYQKAIATGFGSTEPRSTVYSKKLLKVTLDKFTNDECNKQYSNTKKAPDGIRNATQICYGSKTEIKDTCQGDAGGPLQIYNYGVHCTYTVIGITSAGRGCGIVGSTSVYTRVSAFVPWIESVIWPSSNEAPVLVSRISGTENVVWSD